MKILIAIASYGEKNDDYLNTLLQSLREIPYEKDIIVQSNIEKNLGDDIQCLVGLPNADPRSLVFAHRQLFIDNLNNYDLFLYTENDILITQQNIEAFLDISKMLPENQVLGFVRYEVNQKNEILLTDIHYNYHWIAKSVQYIQSKIFTQFNNKHSACYLLTQSQLSTAIKSGNYDNFPRISGAGGILEAASADPFIDCGLEKVICLSDIEHFLVQHLPNNYIDKWGLNMKQLKPQIEAMKKIVNGELVNTSLLADQTKLLIRGFDKKYLNNCDQDVLKKIGSGHRKILSVGCGDGSTEAKLVKMGHDVTAIPLDSIIATLAKEQGIEVITPDMERSLNDLSSRKFDYILFLETLHYITETEIFLQKFLDILEKNGIIIATFMNISSDRYCQLINSDMVNFAIAQNRNKCDSINDKFEFSGFNFINDPNIITNWFTQASLNVSQVIYYPLSWKRYLVSIFSKKHVSLKAERLMIVSRPKL
jgi:2-polyprenyl-3-methyl-5-hydroxy-6-metoxy-1,4-benzoquinol methylase